MTAVAGYFILQAIYPEVEPILPVIIYTLIGYIVAKLVMNVYGFAMDTTLQCFIITEEMHYRGNFVPKQLQVFIEKEDLKGGDDDERTCCCPCHGSQVRSAPEPVRA